MRRDEILERIRQTGNRPMKTRSLARFFDINEEDYNQFRTMIKEMIDEGQLVEARGKLMAPPPEKAVAPEGTLDGIFRLSARGFGFIEPTNPPTADDVFVPPGDNLDAITGDLVRARLIKRHGPRRPGQLPYTGRIIEVLERGQARFVGTYRLRDGKHTIKPDGGLLLIEEIEVRDAPSSGAKPNDKVVFELLKYPAMNRQAQAVITEVLGPRGAPGVDTVSVIRQFDIPDAFSPQTLDAARQAMERFTEQEIAGRTDLRESLIITIDPDGSRDFDDAISIEHLDGGTTRLGVHIADVSFFVRPGEPLDEDAYLRGTSTYFPTTVLPMLPEVLSNGICSLQEGEDRLAKTAFIDLDRDARVLKTSFANSVIRNKKRLTYEQVTQILEEGQTHLAPPEVIQLLNEMNVLARRILQRRRRAGYLELDLPEVDLIFDDNNQVVDARPEDTSFSHKIIEMFMVEANEAVARHLARKGRPFIRREHPAPSQEKLDELARFLRSSGFMKESPHDRHKLQSLLKETKGAPTAYPIHVAVLRSMMQAKYAVSDEGHWALASDCYCHFTSPIRRYPDLSVHRVLAELEGWLDTGEAKKRGGRHKEKPEAIAAQEDAMSEVAAHCSRMERRSEAAERELTKIKVLTLLEKHIGDEYTGVVAGVQNFGIFVEISKYAIEGLVHVEYLQDDVYEFHEASFSLVGRKHGRRVRIGDTVHVVIESVDIPRRELNLVPSADSSFATRKPEDTALPRPPSEMRSPTSRRGRQSPAGYGATPGGTRQTFRGRKAGGGGPASQGKGGKAGKTSGKGGKGGRGRKPGGGRRGK